MQLAHCKQASRVAMKSPQDYHQPPTPPQYVFLAELTEVSTEMQSMKCSGYGTD